MKKQTFEGITIALLIALTQLSTYAYTASMPVIAQNLHTSSRMVQYSLSIYLLGYAVTQVICGPLADLFGRRRVIYGYFVVYVIGCFLSIFSYNIYEFWMGLFIQSVATGAFVSLARTLFRDIYGPKLIVKVMSVVGTLVAIMPVISPVIGIYVALWFGWRGIYWFLLLVGVAICLAIFFVVRNFEVPKVSLNHFARDLLSVYKSSLTHKGFLGYILCMGLMAGGMVVFFTSVPFLFRNLLHVSQGNYGWIFFVTCIGYVIGTLLTHKLHKHFGVYRSTLFGIFISIVASLVALVLIHFYRLELVPAMVLGFIYLTGIGVMLPSSKGGALSQFSSHVGTVTSIMGFSLIVIASIVSAIAASFSTAQGYEHPAAVTFIVAVLAFLALYFFHPKSER